MGGVDVHDQLRLQRYNVQLIYKTRKYYKTLFLRLFDMALVNAFIVFRHHKRVPTSEALRILRGADGPIARGEQQGGIRCYRGTL